MAWLRTYFQMVSQFTDYLTKLGTLIPSVFILYYYLVRLHISHNELESYWGLTIYITYTNLNGNATHIKRLHINIYVPTKKVTNSSKFFRHFQTFIRNILHMALCALSDTLCYVWHFLAPIDILIKYYFFVHN